MARTIRLTLEVVVDHDSGRFVSDDELASRLRQWADDALVTWGENYLGSLGAGRKTDYDITSWTITPERNP